MGMKKRTKPSVPGKAETARRLWIIRWLKNSDVLKVKKTGEPYRFATLWEAATEYVDTNNFKKLVHTYYKK